MSIFAALPSIEPTAINDVTQQATSTFVDIVPNIPRAGVVLAVGILVIRILSFILMRALGLTKLPKGLIKVTVKILDIALWLLLTIAVLQMLGLSNVAIALSGTFAVLALGFSQGISATVNDTISGLNLARDRHFRIGDRVIAGDRKTEGIIMDLDMRKTRLRSDKGTIHVIPNAQIDKNEYVLLERASEIRAQQGKLAERPVAKTATIRGRKGKN